MDITDVVAGLEEELAQTRAVVSWLTDELSSTGGLLEGEGLVDAADYMSDLEFCVGEGAGDCLRRALDEAGAER